MYRYIAFVWNPADAHRRGAARLLAQRLRGATHKWRCVLDVDGLIAHDADARPLANDSYRLPGQTAAVFGKLFTSEPDGDEAKPSAGFDPQTSEILVRSAGRDLVERYWGRYVAVLQDRTVGKTWILRDPTGALPCFLTTFGGVQIIFSDVEDCLQLDLLQFSVNWKFIAALVPYSSLQVRETGLNEVSEVQPGECVEIHGESLRRTFYWEPLRFARSAAIESPEVAVVALRRTARTCVQAWGSCYRGVLHRLSGGLDSSIVLSCLVGMPAVPSISCINYFSAGPEEDERRFARLMAQRAGVELDEHQRDPGTTRLQDLLRISRSARPGFYLYYLEHSRFESELASKHGATALFSGGAGDAVFYQARATLAAIDYVYRHGLRRKLLQVALDAARVDRLSLWYVLREASTRGLRKRAWDPLEGVGQFTTVVNPELVALLSQNREIVHPWLTATDGVPPGKLWHVLSMAHPPSFYDPLGQPDDPENVYPLLSQPLIELCLRLPTYVLIHGGWDRAVARRAFAADVPADIIKRRNKGGSTSNAKRIFEENISFIRELMLDGFLVKERLLDRKKVEECLSPRRSLRGTAFAEVVVDHICTEAWLRRWAGTRQRAAA